MPLLLEKITSSYGHLPSDFAFTFLRSLLLTEDPWLQYLFLWAQYAPEACKGVFDSLHPVNRITGLKTMFSDTGGSRNHTHCAHGSTVLSGPMSTHSFLVGNWKERWISRWFYLAGGLVTLLLLTLLPLSAPGSFLSPCCPLKNLPLCWLKEALQQSTTPLLMCTWVTFHRIATYPVQAAGDQDCRAIKMLIHPKVQNHLHFQRYRPSWSKKIGLYSSTTWTWFSGRGLL